MTDWEHAAIDATVIDAVGEASAFRQLIGRSRGAKYLRAARDQE